MKTPAAPVATSIPAFIQIGENAMSIFNTAEITAVLRSVVPITEHNRDQYSGFITPDGHVYVINVGMKGERDNREIKCASEAIWQAAFAELSRVLNSYIISPKVD
jgi:hypothetical protein